MSLLFFYANWEPLGLTYPTSHFWSLCVEMQFYIAIALTVFFAKDRAIWFLPVYAIAITLFKIYNGVGSTINTYYRVDEVLAGCILAIILNKDSKGRIKHAIGSVHIFIPLALLFISSHKDFYPAVFLRPYAAMLLIGCTLFSTRQSIVDKVLKYKILVYIAGISYALYVIHGGLRYTWLGEGETKIEIYLKRPLFFLTIFVLAHLSTKYFEFYWVKYGKSLAARFQ